MSKSKKKSETITATSVYEENKPPKSFKIKFNGTIEVLGGHIDEIKRDLSGTEAADLLCDLLDICKSDACYTVPRKATVAVTVEEE